MTVHVGFAQREADARRPNLVPAWLELARVLRSIAANHADELRARRLDPPRRAETTT
jgi:hypothetical protein